MSTTTSSSLLPSPSTLTLDDGITTVKHYFYIHSQKPRTNANTKMYHFNWQENIKCKSHCIYTSKCPYRCCPEMCGYCSRSNSYTQGSKNSLYARTIEKDLEGGTQRTYNSPFSWDSISRVSLLGFLHPVEDPLLILSHIPITKMDNSIIITLLKILTQYPNLLLLQLIELIQLLLQA